VAHETGSLVYIDEIAQGPYCMAESGCGGGGGEYFGRGPGSARQLASRVWLREKSAV